MQKFTERLKLIGKEVLNFITNILCPLISVVMVILEIFGVPASVLDVVKKVEYALFYLSGTKEDIEKTIDIK